MFHKFQPCFIWFHASLASALRGHRWPWVLDSMFRSNDLWLANLPLSCQSIRHRSWQPGRQSAKYTQQTDLTLSPYPTLPLLLQPAFPSPLPWLSAYIKGAFTRDYSQRLFLAQHSTAMLEGCWNHWKQCCNNVATLCCAKNRRCESSRVTSP